MNLHAIANPVITSVNPNLRAVLLTSSGFVISPGYGRTPTYRPDNVFAQIQAMTGGDLRQTEGLNLNGTKRGIYLYGESSATERVSSKGGDLIAFPQRRVARTRLINLVLEQWPGWCKVAATLQDDNMNGAFQAFGDNLDTNALVSLASAGAGIFTSADQTNQNYKGLILVASFTTLINAQVQVIIQGKDAASGDYYPLFKSQLISAAGLMSMTMYPGVLSNSGSLPQPLSATWNIEVAITSTGSGTTVTGTIGASLLQ